MRSGERGLSKRVIDSSDRLRIRDPKQGAVMDPFSPTESSEKPGAKPSFLKPSNDAVTRKYKRHSLIGRSDSSSFDDSPKRGRSHNTVVSMENCNKMTGDHQRKDGGTELERESSRYGFNRGDDSHSHSDRSTYRNSHEYRRHNEYSRQERHADEEMNYLRSSRSDRESRRGSRYEHAKHDNNSDRSRDNRRDIDRYSRDKPESLGHRTKDKERVTIAPEQNRYKDRDSDKSRLRDSERAASGSRQISSSRDDVRIRERDKYTDRESRDDRRDRRRSPDYKNDHSSHDVVLGRDSCSQSKEIHRSNKELDEEKDDLVRKSKREARETENPKDRYSKESEDKASKSGVSTYRDRYGKNDRFSGKRGPKDHISSAKKLKLGHLEGDEKPSSSSKHVSEIAEPMSKSVNSTDQAETASDLSATKVAAMKAAELGAALMDPVSPTESSEKPGAKPSFPKPSNDAATRKYQRHSPIGRSNSSSYGDDDFHFDPVDNIYTIRHRSNTFKVSMCGPRILSLVNACGECLHTSGINFDFTMVNGLGVPELNSFTWEFDSYSPGRLVLCCLGRDMTLRISLIDFGSLYVNLEVCDESVVSSNEITNYKLQCKCDIAISDIENIEIVGLEGSSYLDTTSRNPKYLLQLPDPFVIHPCWDEESSVQFSRNLMNRGYIGIKSRDIIVVDNTYNRAFSFKTTFSDLVLWNSGSDSDVRFVGYYPCDIMMPHRASADRNHSILIRASPIAIEVSVMIKRKSYMVACDCTGSVLDLKEKLFQYCGCKDPNEMCLYCGKIRLVDDRPLIAQEVFSGEELTLFLMKDGKLESDGGSDLNVPHSVSKKKQIPSDILASDTESSSSEEDLVSVVPSVSKKKQISSDILASDTVLNG